MQELIKSNHSNQADFINRYEESKKYYNNKNDITSRNNGESKVNKNGKDEPLRHADNRISHNFYQLLVDQEAGYIATNPPQIDIGKQADNQKVADTLGDDFALTLNDLVVDASNAGRGWLTYWKDKISNVLRYGIVPPDQVTPIWSTSLDHKLLAVLRTYKQLDPDTGKYFKVHEYWDDKCGYFFKEITASPLTLEPFNCISERDATAGYETGQSNVFKHGFGRVPFIEFPKNKQRLPELHKVKGLIDAYDDVYNGFLNDVDDIQSVVLVLKNYGGADLKKFMHDLNENKAIKVNNAGNGDQSGVETLQIDIPTEARDKILTLTKSNIFLQGQGIDPANFSDTNASGVAIKMLYSHLELKASNTTAYFKRSVSELVRAIMSFYGMSDPEGRHITQTWTRTKVEDDLTQAQTVSAIANWSSKEAIAKANPIVDDWQQELDYQKQDAEENDGFGSDFKPDNPDQNDEDKQDKKKNEDVDDE